MAICTKTMVWFSKEPSTHIIDVNPEDKFETIVKKSLSMY
jgi:hypothetical protein